MEINQEWIDRQRVLCDAATPGPWVVKKHDEEYGKGYGETTFYVDTIKGLIKIGTANANENYKRLSADTAFIAAARTDIPDLLPEVARLTASLATVTRERDAAVDCIYDVEDDLRRCGHNGFAEEHIDGWKQKSGRA